MGCTPLSPRLTFFFIKETETLYFTVFNWDNPSSKYFMKLTGLISVLLFVPWPTHFHLTVFFYMYNHFHLTTVASQPAIHQLHLSVCVVGITETIAQLVSGWVTDRNLFHKYHYHKAYLILCGLVNLLSPLATSYILLMVYAVFFAIFCGGYMALLLPVLVRTPTYLTNAFVLILVVNVTFVNRHIVYHNTV